MMRPEVGTNEIGRVALDLVREPVFVVERAHDRIVDANRAACAALDCEHPELLARAWSAVESRLGTTSVSPVCDRLSVVVAHQPAQQASAAMSAARDALTGLPGREALRTPEQRPADTERRQALLFIDLDGFKRVNDTFGHLVGDRVLRMVAQRLCESVRPQDLVVRFGGDEFVVLLGNVRRRRDLERLANRIARAIAAPIFVSAHEISMSASIGWARRSADCETMEALLATADRAMYAEKALRYRTNPGLERPAQLASCPHG